MHTLYKSSYHNAMLSAHEKGSSIEDLKHPYVQQVASVKVFS